jgi:hypothetical protein
MWNSLRVRPSDSLTKRLVSWLERRFGPKLEPPSAEEQAVLDKYVQPLSQGVARRNLEAGLVVAHSVPFIPLTLALAVATFFVSRPGFHGLKTPILIAYVAVAVWLGVGIAIHTVRVFIASYAIHRERDQLHGGLRQPGDSSLHRHHWPVASSDLDFVVQAVVAAIAAVLV